MGTGGEAGIDSYDVLVDTWIGRLRDAFGV
jgi:hypothetical protein